MEKSNLKKAIYLEEIDINKSLVNFLSIFVENCNLHDPYVTKWMFSPRKRGSRAFCPGLKPGAAVLRPLERGAKEEKPGRANLRVSRIF